MRKKRICFLNTRSLRRGHSSFCEEPRYYNKVQEKEKTQPNENENKQTNGNKPVVVLRERLRHGERAVAHRLHDILTRGGQLAQVLPLQQVFDFVYSPF